MIIRVFADCKKLLMSVKECTNLAKYGVKIGEIPRLITKFHDFLPIFSMTFP